jgi:hypothetical protein
MTPGPSGSGVFFSTDGTNSTMFGRKKETRSPEVNLLELIPERTVQSETGEDGLVTVLGPRFKTGLMKKLVGSRLKSPYFRINLDDVGSTVWENIDGRRNIGGIAGILRDRFGERIEPCNDRLAIFFTQLEMSRYIRYTNLEEVKARATED